MRVLITPDKFKGTLTARAAAAAIAAGWRQARPADELDLLPMSDGGDGFGEVMATLLGARPQAVRTVDAAHQPVRATWWWDVKTKTAIIETARIIGLAMLPRGQFHPFALDAFGVGAVLEAALKKGARRCLVGIGGSATNDGGFGLARALGWKFLDADDREVTAWTELHRLARLVEPPPRRWFREVLVAVDVANPLLGARGCARIYGPQKGLRAEDMAAAERNLKRLAQLTARSGKRNQRAHLEAGAGAAGGLGFGLRCFAGGELTSGFDLFARLARLRPRMRAADLVISAEGRIDRSTLMGKGVGGVARMARALRKPCLGFAGVLGDRAQVLRRFTAAHALAPDFVPVEEALQHPAACLERLAARVAAQFTK